MFDAPQHAARLPSWDFRGEAREAGYIWDGRMVTLPHKWPQIPAINFPSNQVLVDVDPRGILCMQVLSSCLDHLRRS